MNCKNCGHPIRKGTPEELSGLTQEDIDATGDYIHENGYFTCAYDGNDHHGVAFAEAEKP